MKMHRHKTPNSNTRCSNYLDLKQQPHCQPVHFRQWALMILWPLCVPNGSSLVWLTGCKMFLGSLPSQTCCLSPHHVSSVWKWCWRQHESDCLFRSCWWQPPSYKRNKERADGKQTSPCRNNRLTIITAKESKRHIKSWKC